MSNALETMLREDENSGQMLLHFNDGTEVPAHVCLKENGDISRVEDYGLKPLESVWIGFYDKADLNEQAGLGLMLTLGKSGDRYGVLVCRPEKDGQRGWWNYNFVDGSILRDEISAHTENPFTKCYMDLMKTEGSPSVIGPFGAKQMNAFLSVCQAHASVIRHEYNGATMRASMKMQISSAANDLKQALVKFHSSSEKDPMQAMARMVGINLPKLGPVSEVRKPTI